MASKKDLRKKRMKSEALLLRGASHSKVDVIQKVIPLSLPSGREAQKAAEKAIDNVLNAIVHVLSEGDLAIPNFGRFRASRNPKNGQIRISFAPSERLKQAVDARLSTK